MGLCEGGDNLVAVAFCTPVRAKKIQYFVFGQVFGHCYCTDCRARTAPMHDLYSLGLSLKGFVCVFAEC